MKTAAREDVMDRYAESYKKRTGDNLDAKLPSDKKVKSISWIPEAVAAPGQEPTGIQSPPPGVKDAVEVTRYYERPSATYPNGRHGVYADTLLLHRSDLDTPEKDIPLTPFGYWNRPWTLEGKSPVAMVLANFRNSTTTYWGAGTSM